MVDGGTMVGRRRSYWVGTALVVLMEASLSIGASGSGPPVISAVPARFEPASVSLTSSTRGFVLGAAPCASATCTSLVTTVDGGRTWARLSAPPAPWSATPDTAAANSGAVSQITFAGASDGFAFGPGLWFTTNGTATWTRVSLGGRVLWLGISGGYVEVLVARCTPSNSSCPSPTLQLERTAVGSDRWLPVPGITGYGQPLISLYGTDGWVAMGPKQPFTAPTSIWFTSDGGATWSRLTDPCYEPAQATDLAALASPGGGVLFELCSGNGGAGQEGKDVFVSTNGGSSAHLVGHPPLGGLKRGLAAASATDLVVAASSGADFLYHSSNGGSTWTTRVLGGGAGLSDLAFVSQFEGVVIEGHPGDAPPLDQLLMTRDKGASWSTVAISAASPTTSHRIGPSAIWRDWRTGQPAAALACAHSGNTRANLRSCIDRFMKVHAASASAIGYFNATGSYLIGFVQSGHVDLGYTLSEAPMDCGCFGAVLLNGKPPFRLPQGPSLASPAYAKLRQAYRLPSGQTGLTYPYSLLPFLESEHQLTKGGEELVLQLPLNDLCSACVTPYRARVALRFSALGTLIGTISLGPCLVTLPPANSSETIPVREPACPPTIASPPT